jgi:hypothetical protein
VKHFAIHESDRDEQHDASTAKQMLRTARKMRGNGGGVERPKNGQAKPTNTASPHQADALARTTDGFSHSHSFGLRDSQSSPIKAVGRPTGRRSNDYHVNGSANGPNASNSAVGSLTARKGKADPLRTAWELNELIQPLHRRRSRVVNQPRLLTHYPAVVEFIYNHRYAAGFQVQQRFNGYMSNQRTSQYQLARLEDLGYLQRAPVRSTSPNFPAVFAATRRGIGLVREIYAKHGVEWQGVATEQFKSSGVALDSILHELALTEFDQAVRAIVERRPDVALLMHERRYFHRDKRLEYIFRGKRHRLIPDAGFLLRIMCETPGVPGPGLPQHQMNFVEFDNGTLSTARLAAKYEAYNQWSQSDDGRKYLRTLYQGCGGAGKELNFRLLVIAHHKNCGSDERRLVELFTLALDLPRRMRERIWLTSVEAIHDRPADAPLWVRPRDARSWVPTMRALSMDRASKRFSARKDFVRRRLREQPRHRLLPD